MNTIDYNFRELITQIKEKTIEEIFNDIKNNYLNISPTIQNSIEDFFGKFNYWGKLKRSENIFDELHNRALSLKNHINDYIWLYDNLNDYRSKRVLYAILNNWYKFDFKNLEICRETNNSHYFDLDLIKCDKNEIFVDIGSYTGDTIIDYFNNYGSNNYKKIYCYEITKKIYTMLENNLKYYKNIILRNKAVSDKNETLFLKENKCDNSANCLSEMGNQIIEAVTLDSDIKEKISLLKMDIEGYEFKALNGSINHIKNDKPKLLISVYHNHEDIWKIPLFIKKINPNYNLYLRYYGNNIFPTEIVLIAI